MAPQNAASARHRITRITKGKYSKQDHACNGPSMPRQMAPGGPPSGPVHFSGTATVQVLKRLR
jgi:hypothetical protein